MKRKIMFLLWAAVAVLIMASASVNAASLGTNFGVSGTWSSSWASNFDATSIDGGFTPGDGLGVGFYSSTSSTGDAILEKRFTRGSGDTNAYNVTLTETGVGWNSLSETHYVDYSTNSGATWTRLGSHVMNSSSNTALISGLVVLPASAASLWVRYGVIDTHDGTYPGDPGSYIVSVGASFAVNTQSFIGTNFNVYFNVPDGATGWQNNFYSNSIDGVWNTYYGWLGTCFSAAKTMTNPDATLEKHFDRASGDTNTYAVLLEILGTGWHRMYDTQYITYSIDSGATWKQVAALVQNSYSEQTVGGLAVAPASAQSLWVRYCVGDDQQGLDVYTDPSGYPGLQGGSCAIYDVSAAFSSTPATLGTNFSQGMNWPSAWQSAFDYTSIDGAWNLADGWLGIGFNGLPPALPVGDAILDKYFIRAAGDNQSYDVTMTQDGTGWNRMNHVHYVDYIAGTTGLTQLGQLTFNSYDLLTITGTATIGPNVTAFGVRNGVVDNGDCTSSLTGGGSAIYDVSATFNPVQLAQSNYTFTDNFATSMGAVYSSNGVIYGEWISSTADILNDGGFNYVEYCFVRQASDPTLLTPTVSATVIDAATTPVSLYYSFDNTNWTVLQTDNSTGTYSPATLSGTVNMGSNARLYVRIGGQTANTLATNMWGIAVESVTVAFPAPTPLSVSNLRAAPDGSAGTISGSIVTYAEANKFFIESPDRTGGIVVHLTGQPFAVDDMVNVTGVIETESFGERYIVASATSKVGTGHINPLAMETKYIGGGPLNYNATNGAGDIGTYGGVGLNNMGMLIKTWGLIAQAVGGNGSYFTIQGTDGRMFNCYDPTRNIQTSLGWVYGSVVGVLSVDHVTSGLPYPLICLRNSLTDFTGIQ